MYIIAPKSEYPLGGCVGFSSLLRNFPTCHCWLRGPGTNLFQLASKLLRFTLQRANRVLNICLEDTRVPVPKEIYSLVSRQSNIEYRLWNHSCELTRGLPSSLYDLSILAAADNWLDVIPEGTPASTIGQDHGISQIIEGFCAMIFDAVAVVPWRYPKLIFIEIHGIAQTVLKAWSPVQLLQGLREIANAIKYQGRLLLSNLRRQGVVMLNITGLFLRNSSMRCIREVFTCAVGCRQHALMHFASTEYGCTQKRNNTEACACIMTMSAHRHRSPSREELPTLSIWRRERCTSGLALKLAANADWRWAYGRCTLAPRPSSVARILRPKQDRDPPKVANIENVRRVEPALNAGRKLGLYGLVQQRCGQFDSNESKGAVAESNGTMDMALRPRATALRPAKSKWRYGRGHYGQRSYNGAMAEGTMASKAIMALWPRALRPAKL
ncbi:hypothetical protein B0H13DRAFT_1894302 [Mycena leptocephala]|nr:hypothetical protein B0H13DRAFT_1894302 [Mycena leptocephala]